jgi:broad specificity phosphatase PhoE
MASIFLIRHAQAQFGTHDYDRLSELGERQAAIAAELFAGMGCGPESLIVTGSLKRQRQTADAIAKALQPSQASTAVRTDARLDELELDGHIRHFLPRLPDPDGEIAALMTEAARSSTSYQKIIRRVFTHWQGLAHCEVGESWPAFAARVREVLAELVAQTGRGGNTVAVSSGAVIATIVQQVLGLPDTAAYGLFEAMKNCSVTQLLCGRDRLSLSSFNDTTYLTAAAVGSGQRSINLVTYR